jgi:hypothetical protein
VVGDGTGAAGGSITTAARGAAGMAGIGHHGRGTALARLFIAIARGTAAIGAIGRRITVLPDPSTGPETGRGSPILLVVREIGRLEITGRLITIARLIMGGHQSSRYGRVRLTTGQLRPGRRVASLLRLDLRLRTGPHSKTGPLLPRTGPRRRARRTGPRDRRDLTEAIGGRVRPPFLVCFGLLPVTNGRKVGLPCRYNASLNAQFMHFMCTI